MSDEWLDQTWFAEESAMVEKNNPQEEEPGKKNNTRLYLLAGAGLLSAFLFGSLLLVLILRPNKAENPLSPSAETQESAVYGPLERQLLILQNDIEEADPLKSALAFPPVNFKLSLQDATYLQQNQ